MSERVPWFEIGDPREKILRLPQALERAFRLKNQVSNFSLGRDVLVLPIQNLPPKIGLSHPQGQARLLHDLANIELQAMELAVRTLHEYPQAPTEFREELAEIAISESQHLGFCLDGIEHQGSRWGAWPVHLSLWNTVGPGDSLVDRVLIVHRYLEGSGLDAGESLLKRLTGVKDKGTRQIVRIIVEEEIGHVHFGSRWYQTLARSAGLDPERDFEYRIREIAKLAPRREKIATELRSRAGFTKFEIGVLKDLESLFRA